MKKYHIENIGCDDTTKFDVELTDEELKTIIKVFETNNSEANYGCKPQIFIFNYSEDGEYAVYKALNKDYDEIWEGLKECLE